MKTAHSTDVFAEIRADHDHHRELLDRIAATSGDEKARRMAFRELKREVGAHTRAEERVFYSLLLGSETARAKSAHGVKEHEEARDGLEELGDMELSNPNWIRRFEKLAEELRHHMEEEEHVVFQLAGKVLDETSKRTLARTFREAQREELAC